MTPEVLHLGQLSYNEAWNRQKELLNARAEEEISDTLLVVEHPHVVTLGRRTPGVKELEASGANDVNGVPLFFVERGGEATYHGPGQLVMYPIFKLNLRTGPKAFLRLMEQAIVETLGSDGINAYFLEGKTGVWLKDAKGNERKIASLGIAVRKSVSYHGLALNVNTDLSYFKLIQPCGFAPTVMTSMQEQLGKELKLDEVTERLSERLIAGFLAAKEKRAAV
jgi:lipoate-protein ligase B